MTVSTITEQLVSYLSDAHAIEEQALAQLRSVPNIAEVQELAAVFSDHLGETENQERLVRERLAAHGAQPSRAKDLVFAAGGKGFVLFARSQPDTPGKLAAHAFSYEHLEVGTYELLWRLAKRAGDEQTVEAAQRILDEERVTGERIAGTFDHTVDASLRDVPTADLERQLPKHLADAHALEAQAVKFLQRGEKTGGTAPLTALYAEHLEASREHGRLIDERLAAHDAQPSKLKDLAMSAGALNWAGFFQAQRDTPGKLAAFAFAFEHLEIGAYEQLMRVARAAGDQATVEVAERILGEERSAAARIAEQWDEALDASLRAQGV